MTLGGQRVAALNLKSLTGLRIFAALVVFAHHVTSYQSVEGFPAKLTHAGASGVSFFFILSGFVLAWSLRSDDTTLKFLRRRAARILPLYWLACIAGLGLFLLAAGSFSELGKQIPGLILLQSWFPDASVYFAGSKAGWSLSCEALFYLAFPFLIIVLRKLNTSGLALVLGAAMLVAIAIPAILQPDSAGGLGHWATYIFPPTRALEFVAGVCAALLVRAGWRAPISLGWALAFAGAAFLAADFMPFYLTSVAITLVPYVLLIVVTAQSDIAGRAGLLNHPWTVKLGEWSYAFYLFHWMVLQVMVTANVRFVHLPWWVIGTVSLLLSVAVSGVLCEFVEKPLERRFRTTRKLPVSLSS